MKKLVFILWTLTQSMFPVAANDYPKLTLDNGEITVSVYLPDASNGYYRGTRFDWSGIIERVDYAGHRFYAPLHARHDPEGHDSVSGPADEFAMFNPMGFAEARAGESFVKIGVGLLAKGADDEYHFDEQYRILRVGKWEIENGPDWVRFTQQLTGDRGWAYRYIKTLRLVADSPVMLIEHSLENRGSKTIDISQYNHNFTIIDDMPYGPDYSVEFPFSTDLARPLNDIAWFSGNRIEIEAPLQEQSLWLPVYEGVGRVDYNAATVRNNRSGAAVRFSGDAPVTRMVFWAVERAACPEPFIRIYLEPEQTRQWSTRYEFVAGDD